MESEHNNLTEILAALPAQTPLLVPDELLAIWFPPGVVGGQLDRASLAAARHYAKNCNCSFDYSAAEKSGRFWKLSITN